MVPDANRHSLEDGNSDDKVDKGDGNDHQHHDNGEREASHQAPRPQFARAPSTPIPANKPIANRPGPPPPPAFAAPSCDYGFPSPYDDDDSDESEETNESDHDPDEGNDLDDEETDEDESDDDDDGKSNPRPPLTRCIPGPPTRAASPRRISLLPNRRHRRCSVPRAG